MAAEDPRDRRDPPPTEVESPVPGAAPPTRLEAEVPPTALEGSEAPPTSIEGGPPAVPPTSLDAALGGEEPDSDDFHVHLPRPLREEYEPLREMGSGGEADLLLARHRESGGQRVVKIYRGDRHRDETALEILSNADRDHVVAIEDSGQFRNRWWEVMEYCEEGSLADLIAREGPHIPPARIEEVVREVAAALEHLHALNIPHRDLKPGNILIRSLDPLDLVLADFGLARVIAATKEMHSRVISAGYVSPQAVNGAVSPAMDWWALGLIVAEMAQGRSPFQREDGEWFPEVTILDWIASRPIELSGVEDQRLRRLCEGLTRRDDRRGWRWGAEEVNAWLAGEEPEVVAEAETARAVSTSPFPFLDPATERTQPFTDPVELATAMVLAWEEALAVLSGSAERRADQRALRNFLRSLDLSEAEQILAEQDDAEERLTRLLVQLDPQIAPTFRGYSIDRKGLLELAESSGEGAASALRAIFSERVLLNYSRSRGYEDLAELDAAWHEAVRHFEATLNRAEAGAGQDVLDGPARAAATSEGVRHILAALIDEDARERVRAAAADAVADPVTRRQGWFAAIARGSSDE